MILLSKCPVNQQTLLNLKVQARAAGIGKKERRYLNYIGRVEGNNSAWARWLEHKAGSSGATRLCCLLAEDCLQRFLTAYHRVLATCGESTLGAMHIEALGAQLMFVGAGRPQRRARRPLALPRRQQPPDRLPRDAVRARVGRPPPLRRAFYGVHTYNNAPPPRTPRLAQPLDDADAVAPPPRLSHDLSTPSRPHHDRDRGAAHGLSTPCAATVHQPHDPRRPLMTTRRGAPRFRRAAAPRRASPPGRSRPRTSARLLIC